MERGQASLVVHNMVCIRLCSLAAWFHVGLCQGHAVHTRVHTALLPREQLHASRVPTAAPHPWCGAA